MLGTCRLFHEEIVFHTVPASKVISDAQFVNNSGMQETINSTELGHTRRSMELNGKLELQTLSNFKSRQGFSKKQAFCFQFYSDWCTELITIMIQSKLSLTFKDIKAYKTKKALFFIFLLRGLAPIFGRLAPIS